MSNKLNPELQRQSEIHFSTALAHLRALRTMADYRSDSAFRKVSELCAQVSGIEKQWADLMAKGINHHIPGC